MTTDDHLEEAKFLACEAQASLVNAQGGGTMDTVAFKQIALNSIRRGVERMRMAERKIEDELFSR